LAAHASETKLTDSSVVPDVSIVSGMPLIPKEPHKPVMRMFQKENIIEGKFHQKPQIVTFLAADPVLAAMFVYADGIRA